MPKSANQKTRILKILELLKENTDENHVLTCTQILERLSNDGIEADRKTVLDDLSALEDAGFDLMRTKGKNGGVRLLTREFETAELKMLIDAVASSRFISEEKSRILIDKLLKETSLPLRKSLKRHIYIGNKLKSDNQALLYTVDAVNEAIDRRKKISFFYTDRDLQKNIYYRHNKKRYLLSPWEMTVFDNNYYLIAFDSEAGGLRHFRIDKMAGVNIESCDAEGREKIGELNLNDYCSPIFGMFSGEKISVTVCAPKKLVGVFIDRFGSEISIFPQRDGEFFTTHVEIVESDPFFGWLFSLGDGVTIVSPEEMRQRYQEKLQRAALQNRS